MPEKSDKLWDYFAHADSALYKAKQLGKNKSIVWGRKELNYEDF